ncbi:hypothetical protein DMENIID0001_079510 [Sergentomyia squamirostris]
MRKHSLHDTLFAAALFLVIGVSAASTFVSNDVETLDDFTPLGDLFLLPEDDTVVQSENLIKAIRTKRSAYKVLESPGLRSHFKISRQVSIPESLEDEMDEMYLKEDHHHSRKRRELESEAIEESVEMIDRTPRGTPTDSGKSNNTREMEMPPDVEELPRPEKQVMEPGYYRQARGQFDADDGDSVAEASAINEGIKARAPRVNFITQQQRNIPDKIEARDQKQSMARSEEVYKKPYEAPRYVSEYRSRLLEPPLHPPAQFRADPYEKFRNTDYYEPWRRMRFYDSYMPRHLMPPPPYPAMSSYPEHRFDNPPTAVDMRGYPIYPTPYINDVSYAPLPRPPGARNRRIIYYANLPEVVRSPPNVELRYRYNSDYYPAMETYRNFRQRGEYPKPEISTQQPARLQEQNKADDEGKIEYTRNAGVKVISNLRIQNHQQQPPDYRKYVDETKINDFPVRY